MQEMVELSKLQAQQPEPAAQSVSVPMKDHTGEEQVIVMQAGPSQFGKNLKGDQKVMARTIIIHPFRGCGDIHMPGLIIGKIAIMERGDCMFVDKVRKVQQHGAVAAIIIDNTPGSSTASSPMFSMSGDGVDDVKIPAVFLFNQDASKLLLALSKDPKVEVTISEMKDSERWSQNEEESMFHKLKISVQEFLNKHTGIAFTKIIEVGGFRATIGNDKIRITHEDSKDEIIPRETTTNQQWSQIRKGLLKSILHSESKELFVPLNILRIYYQTLSGVSIEELKNTDVVKQTEWLLTELVKENQKKEDDLVKAEDDQGVSILAELSQLTKSEAESEAKNKREKLAELNSILQTVNQLENAYQTGNVIGQVINKLKDSSDELVVSEQKSDKTDKNSDDDEHIKTRVTHTVDEL